MSAFEERRQDPQAVYGAMDPNIQANGPPAYSLSTADPLLTTTETRPRAGSATKPLPCVVPQMTKSFRGAFASPFIRGYANDLERFGISREVFFGFIDGLNEAWLGHPVFSGVKAVGGVMSVVHGVHPVQIAGVGLQVGADLSGAGTSYFRTKRYMKQINQSLFEPAGLHAGIMNTKDMMAKVRYPSDVLTLPPLDELDDVGMASEADSTIAGLTQDDPRMRRMKALEGYVMPLELDVSKDISAVNDSNPLSKMAAFNTRQTIKKQNKKLEKTRSEEEKDAREDEKETRKEQKEFDKESKKIDKEMAKAQKKFNKEVRKEPEKARKELDKEMGKLEKEQAKNEAKLEKKLGKISSGAEGRKEKAEQKEQKKAQKIRWIVVTALKDADSSDQDSLPTEEEEE